MYLFHFILFYLFIYSFYLFIFYLFFFFYFLFFFFGGGDWGSWWGMDMSVDSVVIGSLNVSSHTSTWNYLDQYRFIGPMETCISQIWIIIFLIFIQNIFTNAVCETFSTQHKMLNVTNLIPLTNDACILKMKEKSNFINLKLPWIAYITTFSMLCVTLWILSLGV